MMKVREGVGVGQISAQGALILLLSAGWQDQPQDICKGFHYILEEINSEIKQNNWYIEMFFKKSGCTEIVVHILYVTYEIYPDGYR